MNLLLDQGLPRGAVKFLKLHGIDAVHVCEIGLSTAEDTAILEWANLHHHVVVTLDADFHTILAMSGANSPAVIRIRTEGLRAEKLANLLSDVVHQTAEKLNQGVAVTIVDQGIRLRNLPIR